MALNIPEVVTASTPLVELYEKMEDDLLRNIAKRLRVDQITGEVSELNDWLMGRLLQLGQLNKENARIIAKYSGASQKALEKAISDAGYGVLEYDETIYQLALADGKLELVPEALRSSPAMKQILRQSIDNARNEMNLINTTALESAKKAFTDAVNQSYLETVTGVYSHQEAVRRAVQKLGSDGIKGAHYVSAAGRHTYNHIDVAVRRAVLTAASQAANEMQLKRAEEYGSDLVEVSSHLGARPSHAEWQGKIYSLGLRGSAAQGTQDTISGAPASHKAKGSYPDFYSSTEYGSVTGLGGANCGHHFYPFFEGLSEQTYHPYGKEENEKAYLESQQQRKIERSIREDKRRMITAEAAKDPQGVLAADKHLKEHQKEMRRFIADTGRERRRDREQLVGYNRGAVREAKEQVNRTHFPAGTKIETGSGAPQMDKNRYNRMKNRLEQQGVEVVCAKGDSLRYLEAINAEATIFGDNMILHRGKIPSASSFFEEIIHISQQRKYGIFDGENVAELYFREVEAQRKLLKHADAYGLTDIDVKDIKRNIKQWENKLRKETGYEFDEYQKIRGS